MSSPLAHTQVETVQHAGTTLTVIAAEYEADMVVEHKQVVADGVVSLVLREAHGRLLPAWEPGAHVDLVLDGVPTRQYSLCGDPADRSTYRLGVLREPERPRWVAARPRPPGRRRRRAGPRPAQPLPARAGRRATCSSPAASASRRS